MNSDDPISLLKLATTIVAAHLSNNQVPSDAIPSLIIEVRKALATPLDREAELNTSDTPQGEQPPIRPEDSIADDYLICLEDGAKVKTLKRYLRRFQLTPDQYRAKWGLAEDYPMTAPSYSRVRHRIAKQIGLGTKPALQTGAARKGRSRVQS